MLKTLLFILLVSPLFGQIRIIPQPAVIQPHRGEFTIKPELTLWLSTNCENERAFLQTYWQAAGLPVLAKATKAKRADVVLLVDASRYEALGPEGYELIVSAKRISIAGATSAGIFYGLQTLRQVLSAGPNLPVQRIRVRDKPRFAWRAFRLNEGPHKLGVVALKKLIDELALLKFNRFDWPPANAKIGNAKLNDFYAPAQIQEITRYAEARHIRMVLPTGSPDLWKGDPKQMGQLLKLGHNLVIALPAEMGLSNAETNLSLDRVYRFEPIPEQLPEDLRPQVLGVQYEYIVQPASTSLDPLSQLHPRLAAAAEVAWTFAQHKDFARFKAGLAGFYNGAKFR